MNTTVNLHEGSTVDQRSLLMNGLMLLYIYDIRRYRDEYTQTGGGLLTSGRMQTMMRGMLRRT